VLFSYFQNGPYPTRGVTGVCEGVFEEFVKNKKRRALNFNLQVFTCGQLLRSTFAVNFCGQLLRSTFAVHFCGPLLRSMLIFKCWNVEKTRASRELSGKAMKSCFEQVPSFSGLFIEVWGNPRKRACTHHPPGEGPKTVPGPGTASWAKSQKRGVGHIRETEKS